PLADPAHKCYQGPYGGATHCVENLLDTLPIDMFPSFRIPPEAVEAGGYSEEEQRAARDLVIRAPETGQVTYSGPGEVGWTLIIKGDVSGVSYSITHLQRGTEIGGPGTQVEVGQQIAEICTVGCYDYRNWHIHVTGEIEGRKIDPY